MHVVNKRRLSIIIIDSIILAICFVLFGMDVSLKVLSIGNFILGTLFFVSDKFYNWLTIEADEQKRRLIVISLYLASFSL
ncbi:hypothetical protein [uncultured Clostridium sp.]|uniref:hypothetical protein n=1 Tax=uncultured Clostridium sp. TaxID=59620 RepID=UPI0028E59810|nr:hypothetical protein [uncultured Clostridium sp.]